MKKNQNVQYLWKPSFYQGWMWLLSEGTGEITCSASGCTAAQMCLFQVTQHADGCWHSPHCEAGRLRWGICEAGLQGSCFHSLIGWPYEPPFSCHQQQELVAPPFLTSDSNHRRKGFNAQFQGKKASSIWQRIAEDTLVLAMLVNFVGLSCWR